MKNEIPAESSRDISMHSPPSQFWGRVLAISLAIFAAVAVVACVPASTPPEPVQVEAEAPEVSYKFYTDEELIEANNRARDYCSQYASAPSMQGTITTNQDGSKTVTFQCILAAPKAPAPPLETYTYSTDSDFLQAMKSADAYCARSGQVASFNVSTNAAGTQTLTYRCIPR
ncbi:MAG: hypothetical protein IH613_14065 [Desulfuromonadales bacterium]|nr:hypothetical protein [Desulfuromonadales bacterium]